MLSVACGAFSFACAAGSGLRASEGCACCAVAPLALLYDDAVAAELLARGGLLACGGGRGDARSPGDDEVQGGSGCSVLGVGGDGDLSLAEKRYESTVHGGHLLVAAASCDALVGGGGRREGGAERHVAVVQANGHLTLLKGERAGRLRLLLPLLAVEEGQGQ